jgi:hypothetical protein
MTHRTEAPIMPAVLSMIEFVYFQTNIASNFLLIE